MDQAIAMLGGKLGADVEKPFFLYLAFGATHAPIQVPRHYIDKYKRRVRRRLGRDPGSALSPTVELGVIPTESKLPPRNPGDPAWSDLSETERRVFARFMEAYAGFTEHTDDQIGPTAGISEREGPVRQHASSS